MIKQIQFKILCFLVLSCLSQSAISQDVLNNKAKPNVWKVSNIGARFQVVDQHLPDLSYEMLRAFSGSEQAQSVDMSGFLNHGDYEFYSNNFGIYVGVSKPMKGLFSQYLELGLDFHSDSEYLVDYYKGDLTGPDFITYGWCVLNSGITGHARYALQMQSKKWRLRFGPGVTFGSTFDGELLLLVYDYSNPDTWYSEERFGSVQGTQSITGYMDLQASFDVFKGITVVAQGKLGQGYVFGLDTRVSRSGVFGIGLEYQF